MAELVWGVQNPFYDLGVDRGVLYLDNNAVAWNGLVAFEERDTTEIDVEHYFEGSRIHISQQLGVFEGLISAYTYPDVFAEYNGYSDREEYKRFSFSYRTQHGLDNYKIHLVYNVLVRTGSRSWSTLSDKIDPSLFNWQVYGTPVRVPGARDSAKLTLETASNPELMALLEDILYGTATTEPRMPQPSEIVDLYEARTTLKVVYNGDGSYTVTGSDDAVKVFDDGSFEITAPTAFLIDNDIFTVRSY